SRAADVAGWDVPTCGPDDAVGEVWRRVRAEGWEVCVVVDEDRVVLGVLRDGGRGIDPAAPAAQAMDPSPVTFRPNVAAGETPDYLRKSQSSDAVVTTSDGVLIGVLRPKGGSTG